MITIEDYRSTAFGDDLNPDQMKLMDLLVLELANTRIDAVAATVIAE